MNNQLVDDGTGVNYVPKFTENKEYQFLYAVHKSQTSRPLLNNPNIHTGTTPIDIITDIEITTQGQNTSSYMIVFDDIVTSVFLDSMKKYGYKLDFISVSRSNKVLNENIFYVWFKEIGQ